MLKSDWHKEQYEKDAIKLTQVVNIFVLWCLYVTLYDLLMKAALDYT